MVHTSWRDEYQALPSRLQTRLTEVKGCQFRDPDADQGHCRNSNLVGVRYQVYRVGCQHCHTLTALFITWKPIRKVSHNLVNDSVSLHRKLEYPNQAVIVVQSKREMIPGNDSSVNVSRKEDLVWRCTRNCLAR
jgi:hypothetical protein